MPNPVVRERERKQVKIQQELSFGQASHHFPGKCIPHDIWDTVILNEIWEPYILAIRLAPAPNSSFMD